MPDDLIRPDRPVLTPTDPAARQSRPTAESGGDEGIRVQIAPDLAAGMYANFFQIRFSPIELVLDFGRMIPEISTAALHSRIILNPGQGRLFLEMLRANVEAYEQRFGNAPATMRRPEEVASIGFRTSEDLRREGLDVPAPRRIQLPSDPSSPEGKAAAAATPTP